MKQSLLVLSVILGYNAHAQSWNITGNANTNGNTHFVGTTDKESLSFRVSNIERMRLNRFNRITFQGVNTAGPVSDRNLFLGGGMDNATGFYNTVLGMGALTLNTTGTGNTAMGTNVMSALTSGISNTGVGVSAMRLSSAGNENVAFGANALEGEGAADQNTAVGQGALIRNNATAFDAIMGNTAVGQGAIPNLNSGDMNTALGKDAFRHLQGGRNNIGIGANSGVNLEGGDNNIFIGAETTAFSTVTKNELNIGNWIVGINGTIGIGSFSNPLPADGIAPDGEVYKLFVKDGIRTEKIKVDIASSNGWADYVFQKDYQLLPLADLESFIHKNGHLPEVPTTEEAIQNGVELKEMNILLLKKIEELTLYSIGQQKRIEALEQQMKSKH